MGKDLPSHSGILLRVNRDVVQDDDIIECVVLGADGLVHWLNFEDLSDTRDIFVEHVLTEDMLLSTSLDKRFLPAPGAEPIIHWDDRADAAFDELREIRPVDNKTLITQTLRWFGVDTPRKQEALKSFNRFMSSAVVLGFIYEELSFVFGDTAYPGREYLSLGLDVLQEPQTIQMIKDEIRASTVSKEIKAMAENKKQMDVAQHWYGNSALREKFWAYVKEAMIAHGNGADVAWDAATTERRAAYVAEVLGLIDLESITNTALTASQVVAKIKANLHDKFPANQPSTNRNFRFPAYAEQYLGMADCTTITGIPVHEIAARINADYPSGAKFKDIKLSGGVTGTDIDPYDVSARMTEIFGIVGLGWDVCPGDQGTTSWLETELKGRGAGYQVININWEFRYALVRGGAIQWSVIRGVSADHSDPDLTYALRGAESSVIKTALRRLGGFNFLAGTTAGSK